MKVNIETERTIVLGTVLVPSCVTIRTKEDTLEIEATSQVEYAIDLEEVAIRILETIHDHLTKERIPDTLIPSTDRRSNKETLKSNLIKSISVIKAFNNDGIKTYQFNMTIKEKKEIRMGDASVEHLVKALEDWEEEKKTRETIVADNICGEW